MPARCWKVMCTAGGGDRGHGQGAGEGPGRSRRCAGRGHQRPDRRRDARRPPRPGPRCTGRTVVVPTGGVHAMARYLIQFGPAEPPEAGRPVRQRRGGRPAARSGQGGYRIGREPGRHGAAGLLRLRRGSRRRADPRDRPPRKLRRSSTRRETSVRSAACSASPSGAAEPPRPSFGVSWPAAPGASSDTQVCWPAPWTWTGSRIRSPVCSHSFRPRPSRCRPGPLRRPRTQVDPAIVAAAFHALPQEPGGLGFEHVVFACPRPGAGTARARAAPRVFA